MDDSILLNTCWVQHHCTENIFLTLPSCPPFPPNLGIAKESLLSIYLWILKIGFYNCSSVFHFIVHCFGVGLWLIPLQPTTVLEEDENGRDSRESVYKSFLIGMEPASNFSSRLIYTRACISGNKVCQWQGSMTVLLQTSSKWNDLLVCNEDSTEILLNA